MATRWFFKVEMDGTPYAMYRMDVNDTARTLDTGRWDPTEQAWVEENVLMGYLMKGEVMLDEVTEEQARAYAPEAFAKE